MEANEVLGKKCSKQLSLQGVDCYCINIMYVLHSWITTFFSPRRKLALPRAHLIPSHMFLAICWLSNMGVNLDSMLPCTFPPARSPFPTYFCNCVGCTHKYQWGGWDSVYLGFCWHLGSEHNPDNIGLQIPPFLLWGLMEEWGKHYFCFCSHTEGSWAQVSSGNWCQNPDIERTRFWYWNLSFNMSWNYSPLSQTAHLSCMWQKSAPAYGFIFDRGKKVILIAS